MIVITIFLWTDPSAAAAATKDTIFGHEVAVGSYQHYII